MGCEQFGRAAQGRSRQTRHRAPIAGAHDDDPGVDCATIKHGHQNALGASPVLAAQEQMKSMILLTDPFTFMGVTLLYFIIKLTLKVEVAPEEGVSKQKLDETKSALRELGLNDDIDGR